MTKISLLIFFTWVTFFNSTPCFSQEDDSFFEDDTVDTSNQKQSLTQLNIDPLEKINRKTFFVYQKFDLFVLDPFTSFYKTVFPKYIRVSISNFSSNLGEPITVANSSLATSPIDFIISINRFFLNSCFGFFGTNDISTKLKITKSDLNFADALRNFGVPDGPFFISPIGGVGGNVIDSASFFQGLFFSPYSYGSVQLSNINLMRATMSVISTREQYDNFIDDARKNSIDLYITQRNFFISQAANRKNNRKIKLEQDRETRYKNASTYSNQMRDLQNYL